MRNKAFGAVLVCSLSSVPASADWFGGADAGWTRDNNFTGAPAGVAKVKEAIASYSLYVGHFTPLADRRSAFIVKADAAAARLNTFKVLDNESYGLSLGLFHGFSRRHSLTATVGGNAQRYGNKQRDAETYYAQVGLKQNWSPSFWLREGLVYDRGEAHAASGEYSGFGANGSFNWAPFKPTLLTLGGAWNRRDYNVAVANERTSTAVSLGLVQQLGAAVYVRAGATAQKNKTNAGNAFDTVLYSVGLGFSL